MNFAEEEPTQEELDDAIVEDTVHCDFCGTAWVLGGHGDGICVQSPRLLSSSIEERLPHQLKLCMDCAALVSRTYEMESRDADRCEHDVASGEWCEECHKAYREARENPDNQ